VRRLICAISLAMLLAPLGAAAQQPGFIRAEAAA